MAKLSVSAKPNGIITSYMLKIHGNSAQDGDVVEIQGQRCGDRSTQFIAYRIEGETGATLKLVLRCPCDDEPGRIVLDEALQILPQESTSWFKL
jgi:hypothetical protein